MKYNLIITRQALLEEMDAYHYYENIREGLGEKFLISLENIFASLPEHPDNYSYSDRNKIIRDVAVDGFPYLIIFEVLGSDVVVYSVHCTSKQRL